jgi:erythromycin esterase
MSRRLLFWTLAAAVPVLVSVAAVSIGGKLTGDRDGIAPLPPARRAAIVSELRTRAAPLSTTSTEADGDDLAALDGIVGDARIVALGEATHGTAEFSRIKQRMIEHLAQKLGFTVVAFEWSWPGQVDALDSYIKTGAGSADPPPGAWRTQEVRDLIEWMRAYNAAPGRMRKLSISGFDIQEPKRAAQCVTDAFARLGPAAAEAVQVRYAGLAKSPTQLFRLPDDERTRLTAAVVAALGLVEAQRAALLKVLTPREYNRVHQCAVVVVRSTLAGADYGAATREQAMAENVRWLAEEAFPGERIVLWAHNLHVSAAPHMPFLVPMGQYLRDAFGDRIRRVGLVFNRGEVRVFPTGHGQPYRPIVLKVPAAGPSNAESVLSATGLRNFMLDLRAVPAGSPLGTWLAQPTMVRSLDWAYDPDYPTSIRIALSQAFDALVYVEESTPTVPLQ